MNLKQIFDALSGLENGESFTTFLKQHLATKDQKITDLESSNNLAATRLKTIGKSLGVEDETAIVDVVTKTVNDTKKELELKSKQVETLTNEVSTLKGNVLEMERKDLVGSFASVVGADRDVLLDLLPKDAELKIEDITEENKTRKRGVVIVNENKYEFADYVEGDSKLSKYKSSIFTQQQNPPQTPPKLPKGKSPDNNQNQLSGRLSQQRSDRLSKLRDRFTAK